MIDAGKGLHVFVTIAELTGEQKQQHLGQLPDDTELRQVLDLCMARIEKYLPEQDRKDARHFWQGDQFLPFGQRYLRDVSTSANVSLELRPDYYLLAMPRRPAQRYAIDPELPVAQVLDTVIGQKGASCCYDLLPRGGRPLDHSQSLCRQDVLPYHARLSQKEIELVVRRKSSVWVSAAALLVALAAAGLGVGYLLARLGV